MEDPAEVPRISVASERPLLVPCSLPGFEYQLDPYVGCGHCCHYCYVLNQAETDWSQEILVHPEFERRLQEELRGVRPQKIYLGYFTDPYQPCESDLRQTRTALEFLRERGFSASLLTKSDMVLRDRDILKEMVDSNVSVSVAFDDDRVMRLFEGNPIETSRRVEVLRRLKEAGVGTAALICPVIPGVTNVFPLLEALVDKADRIWVYGLSVLDQSEQSWRNVQGILETHFPDKKEMIEGIVLDKEHPYWAELREKLARIGEAEGIDLRIHI
jgi:DNA repair photolyase